MKLQTWLTGVVLLVIAVGLGVLELVTYQRAREDVHMELLHVGDHLYNLLMSTRRVYHHQFLDSGLPLNEKTVGFLPAHALSRISEEFGKRDRSGLRFSNVSDRPRNPLNQADEVELGAIAWFREHPDRERRFVPFRGAEGEPLYLYARPIWIEPYCLTCHGERSKAPPTIRELYDTAYGYQAGELRGILSIKLPAAHLEERVAGRFWKDFASHLLLLTLLFVLLLTLLRRNLQRPLRILTNAIEAFGDRREYRSGGWALGDDFRALGEAFNSMTRSVRDQQRELAKREAEIRLLLDSSGEGIYAVDRRGVCIRCNPRAAELLGYPGVESLLGLPTHGLFHHHHVDGSLYPEEQCPIQRVILGGGPVRVEDEVFWRADGSPLSVEYLIHPMIEEGTIVGAVVNFNDITERKRAERRLLEAKEAAEAGDRAKGEFLAVISHEIRTPLNAVIGMGDLLEETPMDDEQRRYLEVSHRASGVLLSLIDEILDFTRIEEGKLELRIAPLALSELVEGAVGVVSAEAAEKGLEIETRLQPGLPERVSGDARRLRQILVNLLSNAVKFTETGKVAVSVDRPAGADDLLRFAVSDSGIGIEPEKQQLIFQPFTQADGSVTRRHGGCGLGLSIVQRLVGRMGGTLLVDSAPGEGSRFSFMVALPAAEAADERPAGRVAEALVEGGPYHILLVEDAADNVELIRAYLRPGGHRLEVAANGVEALERFTGGRFDLVLMDIQMAVMDGYEATRSIRRWERSLGAASTPVLALTAHAFPDDELRCLAAGCDAYLTKPIDRRRLLRAIARHAKTAGRRGRGEA